MKRTIILTILMIGAASFMMTCSHNESPTASQPVLKITGEVLAYFCGVGDINNNTGELRYSVRTGRPAYVSFEDSHGQLRVATTDDSSSFAIDLPAGRYLVSTTADYFHPTAPETVQVSADTSLTLNAVYDFFTGGHYMSARFYYRYGDSLGLAAELASMYRLNAASGHVLDTAAIERLSAEPFVYGVLVRYRLPIRSEFLCWQAFDDLDSTLRADSSSYPAALELDPGYYICEF